MIPSHHGRKITCMGEFRAFSFLNGPCILAENTLACSKHTGVVALTVVSHVVTGTCVLFDTDSFNLP